MVPQFALLRRKDLVEQRNKNEKVMVGSLRLLVSESNLKVKKVSRQLQDCKRRLTHCVRELDYNLTVVSLH